MQFTIRQAKNYREVKEVIEIETMQELKDLCDKYGKHDLIINFDEKEIIIYNDYVE